MTDPLSHRAASLAEAESLFLARRAGPAEPVAAAEAAMRCALGDAADQHPAFLAAARALGEAVERHGAAFAPGAEPAYHNRHHQAEAALAMGWLAAMARDAGALGVVDAATGTLAMIGHDLLHDGLEAGAAGRLEAQSAEATARIARAAGVAAPDVARAHALILGTEFARPAAPDLLLILAREADVMGSLAPRLGWRLSEALAAERAAEGDPHADMVASFLGRLGFLGVLPPPSPYALAFGVGAARASQHGAFTRAAARAGLPATTPREAASALDKLPRDIALAHYLTALDEAAP